MRFALLAATVLISASFVYAQEIVGSSTIDIDANNYGTASCETDLDANAQNCYGGVVSCVVQDQNGTTVGSDQFIDHSGALGFAPAFVSFSATPGNTYIVTGQHCGITIYTADAPESPSYGDYYNFASLLNGEGTGQPYYGYYECFGPGPEQQRPAYNDCVGSTMASATRPTSSRTVNTVSSQAMVGCPAGQAGWDRMVTKAVVDQNGADVLAIQSITEAVVLGSRNDLSLGTVATSTTDTNVNGQLTDRLAFCSVSCPGSSGETDATQTIGDTYQGAKFVLLPNAFVYKCSANTINGQ